jgi:hypothetical protein
MLKPKFTLDKNERLYLTEKYVSNGHWLLTRTACNVARMLKITKAFDLLDSMHVGRYDTGISGGKTCDVKPDMLDSVIPVRDGYKPVSKSPVGVVFDGTTVRTYKYSSDGFETGINPKYVPLLELGHAHAKDADHPILILDSKDLNGELMAVIMPVRLT